jgi:predicted DNA-binding ribbon-helix-helix protein
LENEDREIGYIVLREKVSLYQLIDEVDEQKHDYIKYEVSANDRVVMFIV